MESKNNWKAWLYLAPVLILMAVFTFYPLVNTILISFCKSFKVGDNFFTAASNYGLTFDNYKYLFGYKGLLTDFYEYALPNTLILCFVTVPISIAVALLISVGLNSIKVLGKVFQTIFFVPYVTNAIAVGMVFAVIFSGDDGLWNSIFNLGDTPWVGPNEAGEVPTKFASMFALCVYIVWHALPYKILIFLSGLQNIDKQYYQAAKIDCAGKAKTFFRITVPLLSPQIVYVLITSLIGGFKEYSSVVALFNGKSNQGSISTVNNMYTVVYFIYDRLGSVYQPHIASAAAVVLFLIILFFTIIQKTVLDKRTHY